MSLDQQLFELFDLFMTGELSEKQTDELLVLLHKNPKAVGVFRDLLATDYHLRETYHDEVYQKSLREGVAQQLRVVATADDFVASTLARIRDLGARWADQDKMKRRSFGAMVRLAFEPFATVADRLREFLPSSE